MTPEIRAARDRIAADADEAERVHSSLATTRISDLRLVLAALDRALPTRYDPKPHGHPWHACGSCSSDGMHPGNGCTNCRHTGFDQTPCRKCDDDPASRVILKPIDAERPMEPDESRCARCLTLFAGTALRSDPHRRYLRTAYCRACVQACNEAPAGHRCVICAGD